MLADDVDEDVESAPVGHAEDRLVHRCARGGFEDGIEDHDRRLAAFEAEALLAHVLGGEELLEGLGRVEAAEDVLLGVGVELDRHTLDLLLDPGLLFGFLDVHVLDADGAAVGVTQDLEDRAQRHPVGAGEAAREVLAIEVPDREAVGERVELGVHVRLAPAQRVEIGDEVAPHPVHVDEPLHGHLLLEPVGLLVDRAHVGPPLDRLVRHAERPEDVLVEVVGPEQQLVHPLQEQPRLGALDDAVVVGRRDRDDLRQAEVGQRVGVGGLVLRRVVDRADTHDEALAGHEPRHRLHGADGSGVGQADGDTGEVVGRELVVANLADQLLVAGPEALEVERVGVTDHRHHQGP